MTLNLWEVLKVMAASILVAWVIAVIASAILSGPEEGSQP
jgi:hypothetical protein